jgi:thiamine biosynthesis lipoprotein
MMKKLWGGILLVSLFLLIAGGCVRGRTIAPVSRSEFVLGTVCTVTLYEKRADAAFRAVFARLRELEDMFSANRPGTDLDRINQNAGIAAAAVPAELIDLLEKARYYAELSGGAFDPSIGPLVKRWGIGSEDARVPEQAEIDAVLPLINWRDIVIDREARTVFLNKPGMALDLGAIAKGYAADEAVRLIEEAGLSRAIVDLGGNIFAYGVKEAGRNGAPDTPWRVGVQNPLEERGAYIGVIEALNKTVVTSGMYERFLETGGRRYHHILSPDTGYPSDKGLLSVTITADCSADADALSTAAFTLGYEAGNALVNTVPGAAAMFVFEDMSVRITPGLAGVFTLSDQGYRIID